MSNSYKSRYAVIIFIIISSIGVIISWPWLSRQLIKYGEIRIKITIAEYFDLKYDAIKTKKEFVDFSSVIDERLIEDIAWLNLERDKHDVQLFIHKTYGTRIIDYQIYINCQSIEINGDTASVNLFEGNEVTYKKNPEHPSKLANLEHEIWLKRSNSGWKIVKDVYRDHLIDQLEGSSKEKLYKIILKNR